MYFNLFKFFIVQSFYHASLLFHQFLVLIKSSVFQHILLTAQYLVLYLTQVFFFLQFKICFESSIMVKILVFKHLFNLSKALMNPLLPFSPNIITILVYLIRKSNQFLMPKSLILLQSLSNLSLVIVFLSLHGR